MEKNKTAIDWLMVQLVKRGNSFSEADWDIIEKAKQMEKEQFIQCAKYSFNAGMKPLSVPEHAESFARHFYKQKYGDSN